MKIATKFKANVISYRIFYYFLENSKINYKHINSFYPRPISFKDHYNNKA